MCIFLYRKDVDSLLLSSSLAGSDILSWLLERKGWLEGECVIFSDDLNFLGGLGKFATIPTNTFN